MSQLSQPRSNSKGKALENFGTKIFLCPFTLDKVSNRLYDQTMAFYEMGYTLHAWKRIYIQAYIIEKLEKE